jgi:hypothetical protein
LNSTNGDYYEKTGAAVWTLRGNLKGPAGAPGAAAAWRLHITLKANAAGTIVKPTIATAYELPGNVGGLMRAAADLTGFTQARLILGQGGAASAGLTYAVQYSADSGATWNYLDGAAGPSVTPAGVSAWVNITAAAKADVFLRCVVTGGDSVKQTTVANVYVEVK